MDVFPEQDSSQRPKHEDVFNKFKVLNIQKIKFIFRRTRF